MLLIAPDSFKGSVASTDVAQALADGFTHVRPSERVVCLPLADGGEGTVAVLARAVAGAVVTVETIDPWGQPLHGEYLRADQTVLGLPPPVAVVEWASAAGFVDCCTPDQACQADSGGVGRIIRAAVGDGCRSLVLGLGGSATSDGAAGLLRELGAELLDAAGQALPPGGSALKHLDRVNVAGLLRLPTVLLADVDIPLHGPGGTIAMFGPQKGADTDGRRQLDWALHRWAAVVDPDGRHPPIAGAGAAGGAGFGLMALLGARLRPGASAVADICQLDRHLAEADAVWTGEGRLDATTLRGKVVSTVLDRVRRIDRSIPLTLIRGDLGAGADDLDVPPVARIVTLVQPPSVEPPPSWSGMGTPLDPATAMAQATAELGRIARAIAHTRAHDGRAGVL